MLPFSDEGHFQWIVIAAVRGSRLADWGFEGQREKGVKKKDFRSSPHFYLIFIVSPSACVHCVFCVWGAQTCSHSNCGSKQKKKKKIRPQCRFSVSNINPEPNPLLDVSIQIRISLYCSFTFRYRHFWYCRYSDKLAQNKLRWVYQICILFKYWVVVSVCHQTVGDKLDTFHFAKYCRSSKCIAMCGLIYFSESDNLE